MDYQYYIVQYFLQKNLILLHILLIHYIALLLVINVKEQKEWQFFILDFLNFFLIL